MNVLPSPIDGVYLIELDRFEDNRGSLTKIYTETVFKGYGLPTHFPEHFFSISGRDVIRGMHGQSAHTECGKLIYVSNGSVLDAVLDVRPDSPTYKNFFQTELSSRNHTAIYIPEGCLHGFRALEDNTHTVYFQTKMRDPDFECGVQYDSFGMNWGNNKPILSERDQNLPSLEEFITSSLSQNTSNV
ncbi:dTDP-4-dehydrorhamnose 3,5-epimerase family protein [Candidatus Nomurabacteria bacterium]|nr:dTDP-4-dehydrorhamnose 3,5-epimerase family protein [Candidatus Nomurabacteria bacterium]